MRIIGSRVLGLVIDDYRGMEGAVVAWFDRSRNSYNGSFVLSLVFVLGKWHEICRGQKEMGSV